MASRMPTSYEDRVAVIPGVAASTGVLSDLAVTGEDMVHIFVRGVDPERYRDVHHIEVDPEAWAAFRENPRAALIGYRLLDRMGWEIGNEVEIAELGLSMEIVGIIPAQGVDLESHMLMHRRYLQISRVAEGQVSYILVSPEEDRSLTDVAETIDETLALTPVPTETVSSAAYAEAVIDDFMGFIEYLKLMGFITVLITMIGAGNAIAMSVRERTHEIGILKAIGFPPRLVLLMVLLESVSLSLLGGAIGIIAATLVVGSEGANMAGLMLSVPTVVLAAVLSILVGFLGGLFPAIVAARSNTIDAIRVIE